MTKGLYCLSLVSAALTYHVAFAQEPVTVPDGPLLKPAPVNASWKVSYSYKSDKKDQADKAKNNFSGGVGETQEVAKIRSVEVECKAGARHVKATDSKGVKGEVWQLGGAFILKLPDYGKDPVVMLDVSQTTSGATVSGAIYGYMGAKSFPGFEWISKDKYVGRQKIGDVDCMVFRDGEPTPDATYAWVNLSDRLPVAWTSQGETRKYEYGPAPEQITIPEDVAKINEGMKRDTKSAAAGPARKLP
jgi:hypothetical protein